LRFTAEHENVIVIVVSSDTPVSVMMGGEVVKTKWDLENPLICNIPVSLEQWVAAST
jgi:hypothetical protein